MEGSFPLLVQFPDLLALIGISLCGALIGWGTNWGAVQLTFRPVTFKGLTSWFGWQGIVPAKAEKIAGVVVDRTLLRLGDLSGVFRRMEPELITRQIIEKLSPRLEEIIDEVMDQRQPVLWNNLPRRARERVYHWARQQLPLRVEALMADFADEITDLVDLKALVIDEIQRDRSLMNRLFLESGAAEFRFIIRSGFWFGLVFAAVPGWLWLEYGEPWLLILGGFLVGTVTNWLALNILFRPVERKLVLGLRLQGLFLQRQQQVAETWSQLVAAELLTVEKVANAMVNGPKAHRTRAIIMRHIRPALEKAGVFRVLTQLTVGADGYVALKDALNEKAIEISTEPFRDQSFNRDRANVVAELIFERMAALPPKDFQDVLRPAFQEEEWQLVLLGGLFGALAGALQSLVVLLI